MICPLCGKDEYVEKEGCPYCGFVIPPDYNDDQRVDVPDEDHVFFEKLGLSGDQTLPDPDSVSMDDINAMMMKMGMDPIEIEPSALAHPSNSSEISTVDLMVPVEPQAPSIKEVTFTEAVPETATGTASDIDVVPDLDMSSMSPEDFAKAISQMMSTEYGGTQDAEPNEANLKEALAAQQIATRSESGVSSDATKKKKGMKGLRLVGYRANWIQRISYLFSSLLGVLAALPQKIKSKIGRKNNRASFASITHEETTLPASTDDSDVNTATPQEGLPEPFIAAVATVREKRRVSKKTKDRLFYILMPILMLGLVAAGIFGVLQLQMQPTKPQNTDLTEEYHPWTPNQETPAPLVIEGNF